MLNMVVGIDNTSAEHVKYGGDLLWRCLLILFSECIKHDYIPKAFSEGFHNMSSSKVNAYKSFDID